MNEPSIHFVGFNDCFEFKPELLKNYPCFAKGTYYLVEVRITKEVLKELENLSNDLESRLIGVGVFSQAAENIAKLLELKPMGIIPCATDRPPKRGAYGSPRDQEILHLVKVGIGKFTTLGVQNITFYGGSKHAEYLYDELDHPNKFHHDFRIKQSDYNSLLKDKLEEAGIIHST